MLSRAQLEFPEVSVVHRLDMGTSGIMMLARHKAIERALSILFQSRKVYKRYVAVIAGRMRQDSGEINLPLITDWPNRPRQMVSFEVGKPSCTRYRVLAYDAVQHITRVELEPVTGRSHQLRVHLQALGNPILGDELYASAEICGRAERLLLHATDIRFFHPITGEELLITTKPPF